MTGGGAPGAAGIIRCLQQDPSIHIVAVDADENAIGKYLVNDFECIPHAHEAAFIPRLLEICKNRKISVIMPLVTKELFLLSTHRRLFENEGIQVLVSPEKAIEIANNKSACYSFLKNKGMELPRFYIVRTVEEFIHAAYELGHPQKAFCFKPSVSNGSRGFRIVSDSLDESEQLFRQKPYNVNMTYAHALKILSSKNFPELLVSEYLPGEEYSVDCLADMGKTVLVVPRSRKKMVNGISVQGEFVRDEKIIDYSKSIIETLGLHGNIGIQVKYADNGNPLLVEINPRVQGTIVSALGAGVNLPLLAVKQASGIAIKEEELKVKWGTRFSRYWTEVYY